MEITAAYPAGMIGTTKENFAAAAAGEEMEWGTLYPKFAATADKEGFSDIAKLFKMVATVETHHHQRYSKLLENVENGSVFKEETPAKWYCRNCGFIHEGKSAPAKCPSADTPRCTSNGQQRTTDLFHLFFRDFFLCRTQTRTFCHPGCAPKRPFIEKMAPDPGFPENRQDVGVGNAILFVLRDESFVIVFRDVTPSAPTRCIAAASSPSRVFPSRKVRMCAAGMIR